MARGGTGLPFDSVLVLCACRRVYTRVRARVHTCEHVITSMYESMCLCSVCVCAYVCVCLLSVSPSVCQCVHVCADTWGVMCAACEHHISGMHACTAVACWACVSKLSMFPETGKRVDELRKCCFQSFFSLPSHKPRASVDLALSSPWWPWQCCLPAPQ